MLNFWKIITDILGAVEVKNDVFKFLFSFVTISFTDEASISTSELENKKAYMVQKLLFDLIKPKETRILQNTIFWERHYQLCLL